MICRRCRTKFEASSAQCPGCGARNARASGTFQTSTVLIATRENDQVFRSVEEVPSALRSELMKHTNGGNSATILIADRRGRQELARVMRGQATAGNGRGVRRMLGDSSEARPRHSLTASQRKALAVIVGLLIAMLIALLFSRLG